VKYALFPGCLIQVKYPQFEAAVKKTMPNFGVELVDLEGFSCCPDPIYFKAFDKIKWASIAARNLSIAEAAGLDIVTLCSGCTATLKEANHLFKENENLRKEVSARLARIDRTYKGTVKVKHLINVVRDEVGEDKVKASVKVPLEGLKVGIHYGCHLLKPSNIMEVDHPDNPTVMETMLRAIGANPVRHKEFLLCCGKACVDNDMPQEMTFDVMSSVEDSHSDCMGLICPACFDSFDLGQIKLGRRFDREFNIPVVYYFQLLGLAQGFSPEEMGLDRHKIKVDRVIEKVTS
jgi:heterodisulfide reductase subunit B